MKQVSTNEIKPRELKYLHGWRKMLNPTKQITKSFKSNNNASVSAHADNFVY